MHPQQKRVLKIISKNYVKFWFDNTSVKQISSAKIMSMIFE